MRITTLFAGAGLAAMLAACQTTEAVSVADYCADTERAMENVCQLNVEIGGAKAALAETDMSLSTARQVADSALSAAEKAQADAARAMEWADAAMMREDELFCETRTINKTDTGSCAPGYKLMSCQQTRYTYAAGGLSFLREINDKTCRFNSRVLEMQVRCCMAGAAQAPVTASSYTIGGNTGGGR